MLLKDQESPIESVKMPFIKNVSVFPKGGSIYKVEDTKRDVPRVDTQLSRRSKPEVNVLVPVSTGTTSRDDKSPPTGSFCERTRKLRLLLCLPKIDPFVSTCTGVHLQGIQFRTDVTFVEQ